MPSIILMATVLIPTTIDEVMLAYSRMIRDGYPLDYLNVEYNVNEIRNKIMPISKRYGLDELMDVIKKYISVTNRRVTFEYIMLDKINDREKDAIELSKLLKGINCYVNLIPYNETENIEFKRTKSDQIMKFYDILKKNRINVTIRKEFGSKVDAACGQLRANQEV